jgi:hypothetical protein
VNLHDNTPSPRDAIQQNPQLGRLLTVSAVNKLTKTPRSSHADVTATFLQYFYIFAAWLIDIVVQNRNSAQNYLVLQAARLLFFDCTTFKNNLSSVEAFICDPAFLPRRNV